MRHPLAVSALGSALFSVLLAPSLTAEEIVQSPSPPVLGVSHGVVNIYPPARPTVSAITAWSVVRPDGAAQNCEGTTTSCYNEANADAYSNGWSVDIWGTGEFKGGHTLKHAMQATSPDGFVTPPLANRYVALHGVLLYCIGVANKGCLNLDTMIEGKFICDGCQIGALPESGLTGDNGTYAILIAPRTKAPVEDQSGLASSYIELGNFTTQPRNGTVAQAALGINLAAGGINNNIIVMNEANTGGSGSAPTANYDIYVFGADTYSFSGNIITGGEIHLARQANIRIGGAGCAHQNFYSANQWRLGGLRGAPIGIDTCGTKDTFDIGSIDSGEGGALTTAIVTEPGSAGALFNTFNVNNISATKGTSPWITDNNKWQNNYFVNGKWLNRLDQMGQYNGLAPSTLDCGANASFLPGSTNGYGAAIVGGTGSQKTCQVTYSITYQNAPLCLFQANQNGYVLHPAAQSTSGFTVASNQKLLAGTLITWRCE